MLYTLSQEFGVSKSNSALLVSVFMFFLVISPMCVGILLDRIGVRKALLVSTFLVGISGAGIYFAPNFLVLVGVRSFEALFVPVLVTSIMVSIASMFRHMDFNRALAGYVSCTLGIRSSSLYLPARISSLSRSAICTYIALSLLKFIIFKF